MPTLTDATKGRPFSNGTEGDAWMGVWCEHCTHDHGISHADAEVGEGCQIILLAMLGGDEWRWPEAWLPEPAGSFSLPSRMICGQFQPCHRGQCQGDPHAETRAAISAEVTAFWLDNAKGNTDADSD